MSIDERLTPVFDTVFDTVLDTDSGLSLAALGVVKRAEIVEDRVAISLSYPFANATRHAAITEQLTEAVGKALPNHRVAVDIATNITARQIQPRVQALPNITNVIAVASGKGGVGKSTIAVNIAVSLAGEGARVGILDADIYGPSVPRLLGVRASPESPDGKTMEPIMAHGVAAMSIGFLVDDNTPMVWRGPMIASTLLQLLRETRWPELDYLIVDLPPGTGDIQLTLAEQIPVAGAVIVTTPQKVALSDAQKAIRMFEKTHIACLGVVENMATYTCPHCGTTSPIFLAGGGERLAAHFNIPLLAQLPLDARVVVGSDDGAPLAANATDSHEETPALADSADSQAHETASRTIQLNAPHNRMRDDAQHETIYDGAHHDSYHDTHWPSAYQALARRIAYQLSARPKHYQLPGVEVRT